MGRSNARRTLQRSRDTLEVWRDRRDDAIRELHRYGVPVAEIAELAGLTRQRIYQLTRAD